MNRELKVISDSYDFVLWLVRHVEKFPRHHRYSLGRDMEGRLQAILGLLLRAKYSKRKAALLTDANMEMEILRFQIRLSTDLGLLSLRSHEHAARSTDEIGRQIGGWASSRSEER